MGLVKEFKDFAMRGNVMDMAVGIIIGVAFGKIVSSLVSDVLMPPIGLAMGGVSFKDKNIILKDAVPAVEEGGKAIEAVTLNYGVFIDTIINFLIVAIAIFVVIKIMNSAKKKEEAAPAAPPKPTKEEVLLAEIRDAIQAKN